MEVGVFDKAKPLEYADPIETHTVPAYFFTELSTEEQHKICTQLAQLARQDNMFLIYELGYGNSLSPVDSAGAGENRAVLAFDIQGKSIEKLVRGTENIKIPSNESNSFAAFFKLDFTSLPAQEDLPKADVAYSIAPFPNAIPDIVNVGLQLAGEVFVVTNPDTKFQGPIDVAIPNLPPGAKGQIIMLNKEEIESRIGTSNSAFLGGIDADQKIPVIQVNKV